MKNLIQSMKDFKIIPGNYKSSGAFELISVSDDEFKAKLLLVDKNELSDYIPNSTVEVFGVNQVGLVYFETKLLSRNDYVIELAITQDYSIIQRREYSRVAFKKGTVVFKDLSSDFVHNVEDISAGGMKLVVKEPLDLEKEYDIEISLSNNMIINCSLKPMRITKSDDSNLYIISGKFLNIENVDRIVLVQYAFKLKMEEQNKENN